MSAAQGRLRRLVDDLRPLDPIRSIKAKLGVLVAASVIATASLTWYGLSILDLSPRYTLPIAIVGALLVTQLLAHGTTAPLRQMTAAAQAMAAGRPAPPVRTTSRDEVGELARAFAAMARELETADEQRRELLANVGHELRTPVAALRAQLENLVDGVRPADGEALSEALEQVQRLGDLLTDLLELAGAEAGVIPLERRPVRVGDLARDVAREVAAIRRGARIDVDVVPADLIADADEHRLRQVLTNLIDNAGRHAPAGGLVQVRARGDGAGGLVLEVTDDGPGIPPDRWETVFERFARGTTGEIPLQTGGGRGTGLGLAIARWAVVLHGGRIAVVPAEGGGCRVRADIPASLPR